MLAPIIFRTHGFNLAVVLYIMVPVCLIFNDPVHDTCCRFYKLCATDIMQSDIVFLSYRSTYRDLKFILQTSKHASYPLVDAPGEFVLSVPFKISHSMCIIGALSQHALNFIYIGFLTQ